ncbi:flagellar motor protein MotB [Thiomicrospira microaerophila]|uniref:OmpA/MotB family protein n=1 Tax=Thiomicrospira microaerophila TaxID=406020 RepID=UPI00200F16D1|nr:flagellar motor protein MotB [Thiomicrospira microaerophila]UQB41748.1 flagellar motor protein MotB [Thiomicrospira microaerophila]
MARRVKKCRQKMPWLMTFADMVTLLLAFFILMFTVAEVDQAKYEQALRSLTEALTKSPELSVIQETYLEPLNPTEIEIIHEATPPESLIKLYESIQTDFSRELDQQQVVAHFDPEKEQIKIIFPETISFNSGQSDLHPRFVAMLRRFSGIITEDVNVKVVGHSDPVPIRGGRYRSNWELSSARAAAVILQFLADGVIVPHQAMAIGLADTHPFMEGDTEEAYAANRRIEIIIEPKEKSLRAQIAQQIDASGLDTSY